MTNTPNPSPHDPPASAIWNLFQEIEHASSDADYLFRGEPECYPKVSSRLYRQYEDEIDADVEAIGVVQNTILTEAKSYTDVSEDRGILAALQHYGGTTNLIDFTTDYRVALFFACDGGNQNQPGRVVLLHRAKNLPLATQPTEPQNRVLVQKSIFIQAPQGFVIPDGIVVVPSDLKRPILEHLRRYSNISSQTIYNDLHGFIRSYEINGSWYVEFSRGLFLQQRAATECRPEASRNLYERSYRHYTRSLESTPNAVTYNNRGLVLAALNRVQEAITDFTFALQVNPEYFVSYFSRGNMKALLSRSEEAIADYTQAINLKTDYEEAYFRRGYVELMVGRNSDALRDLAEVIRLNPRHYTAYFNRGIAHSRLGSPDEARKDFEVAREMARQVGDDSLANKAEQALPGLAPPEPSEPGSTLPN